MKKILVTGSNGIIGTRLCERLLELNYEVIGIDNTKTFYKEEVNKITKNINLLNEKQLYEFKLKNIDLIIHLAAHSHVNQIKNLEIANENVVMTKNILKFMKINNINKIIFSSSREVYGNVKIATKENEINFNNNQNLYGISKIECEKIIKESNIKYIIFRITNTYGMYDISDRIIPTFIDNAINDKDLILYGVNKKLEFIYIDDVISTIIKSIEQFDKRNNNVFNLCTGKSIRIKFVATLIINKLNSKSKIKVSKNRIGETINYIGDTTKLNNLIDTKKFLDISYGIDKTLRQHNVQIN